MAQVAVAGVGLVLPGAVGDSRAWPAAGLKLGELTLFAPPGQCEHAGEVTGYDWKQYLFSNQTYADRCTQLALGAARLGLEEAGLTLPLPEAQEVGLCFGTRWGCLDSAERFYAPLAAGKGKLASSLVFSHSYPNCPTSFVAIELGLRGYSASFAGSAEAGWWALRSGFDAIAAGTAGRVLVGAAEGLGRAAFAHAEAAEGLPITAGQDAPEPLPADSAWRRIPAEGAVFVLLEAAKTAEKPPLFSATSLPDQPPATDGQAGDYGAVGPILAWLAAGLKPES